MNAGVAKGLGVGTSSQAGRLNAIASFNGPLSAGDDPKATLNHLYGLSYIFEVR